VDDSVSQAAELVAKLMIDDMEVIWLVMKVVSHADSSQNLDNNHLQSCVPEQMGRSLLVVC
jgi:hypothetical protein